jgi:KaiC/GvpD/RAD55 family RecA-like ATPase
MTESTVIVTEAFSKILQYAKDEGKGVLITGPQGTGKSTALHYIRCQLEGSYVLFIGAEAFNETDYFKEYLRINKFEGDFDQLEAKAIVMKILQHSNREERKYLLVEERGSDEERLYLHTLVSYAIDCKWIVVVATSSGRAWMTKSKVRESFGYMRNRLKEVFTENFSEEEAMKFISGFEIEEEFKREILDLTGGNPFLLNYFSRGVMNEGEFHMRVNDCEIAASSLLDTLSFAYKENKALVVSNICQNEKWLWYALTGEILKKEDVDRNYYTSYLHNECITYVSRCCDGYRIKLGFPVIFDKFMNLLNREKDSIHLENFPVFQGLIFEQEFLQCSGLKFLNLQVTDKKGKESNLEFAVLPAQLQARSLLTSICDERICHLKVGHKAIDAVCCSYYSLEKYLLLIQVSLSPYHNHASKWFDICDSFEGKKSMAEYYRHLAQVDANHVIYLYISPKELAQDGKLINVFELKIHDTGSHSLQSSDSYLFGLLMKGTVAAELTKNLIS